MINEPISQASYLMGLDLKMNEESEIKVRIPRLNFETKTIVAQ